MKKKKCEISQLWSGTPPPESCETRTRADPKIIKRIMKSALKQVRIHFNILCAILMPKVPSLMSMNNRALSLFCHDSEKVLSC